MAREPTYPKDAPVGEAAAEIAAQKAASPSRTRQLVTGAAIGIGSAALVAALLYANRARKTEK
ncbi:MAG TPA: hypothetical protein VJS15_02280 [Allosphingosinicella sp.]|nr:hypothetical protein [Allosphingosinicella sp.]